MDFDLRPARTILRIPAQILQSLGTAAEGLRDFSSMGIQTKGAAPMALYRALTCSRVAWGLFTGVAVATLYERADAGIISADPAVGSFRTISPGFVESPYLNRSEPNFVLAATKFTNPNGGLESLSASVDQTISSAFVALTPYATVSQSNPGDFDNSDTIGLSGDVVCNVTLTPTQSLVLQLSGSVTGTLGSGATLDFGMTGILSYVGAPDLAPIAGLQYLPTGYPDLITQPGDFHISFSEQQTVVNPEGFTGVNLEMRFGLGIFGGPGSAVLDPGLTVSVPGQVSAPEPSTFVMLIGMAGVACVRRRRKRMAGALLMLSA